MQSPQSCADAADAEQALRMGMGSPEWYDSSTVAPEKDTSTCAVRFKGVARGRESLTPYSVVSEACKSSCQFIKLVQLTGSSRPSQAIDDG